MITDALEAITSRKWLMELILAAVLIAGVFFFCQHLISVGVQKQRDADLAELVVLQHDADIKTAKAQERADLAEKARDIEITQLDDYRRLHPLHGRLCVNEGAAICPQPAPLTAAMLVPAPAPGIFSKCLRELLDLADKGTPMSDTCSTFLQDEPTL